MNYKVPNFEAEEANLKKAERVSKEKENKNKNKDERENISQ